MTGHRVGEFNEVLLNRDELWGLAFRAAGAATGPLLQDNPHYVFPAERVSEAVGSLLIEEGYGPPPQGYTILPSEAA